MNGSSCAQNDARRVSVIDARGAHSGGYRASSNKCEAVLKYQADARPAYPQPRIGRALSCITRLKDLTNWASRLSIRTSRHAQKERGRKSLRTA